MRNPAPKQNSLDQLDPKPRLTETSRSCFVKENDNFEYTAHQLLFRTPIFPPKTHIHKRDKVDDGNQREIIPGVHLKAPRPYWETPVLAGRVREQEFPPKEMTYAALTLGLSGCSKREMDYLDSVKTWVYPLEAGRRTNGRPKIVQGDSSGQPSTSASRPGTVQSERRRGSLQSDRSRPGTVQSQWSAKSVPSDDRYHRIHRVMERVYGKAPESHPLPVGPTTHLNLIDVQKMVDRTAFMVPFRMNPSVDEKLKYSQRFSDTHYRPSTRGTHVSAVRASSCPNGHRPSRQGSPGGRHPSPESSFRRPTSMAGFSRSAVANPKAGLTAKYATKPWYENSPLFAESSESTNNLVFKGFGKDFGGFGKDFGQDMRPSSRAKSTPHTPLLQSKRQLYRDSEEFPRESYVAAEYHSGKENMDPEERPVLPEEKEEFQGLEPGFKAESEDFKTETTARVNTLPPVKWPPLLDPFHKEDAILKRRLAEAEYMFGSESLQYAHALAQLGDLYQVAGEQVEGARAWYTRALGVRRVKLGENHPHVLMLARKIAALPLTDYAGHLF